MNLLWYSEVDFAKHIDSGGFLRHYYVMRSTRDVVRKVGTEHFSIRLRGQHGAAGRLPQIVNSPFC
jgi:hypothetical protein